MPDLEPLTYVGIMVILLFIALPASLIFAAVGWLKDMNADPSVYISPQRYARMLMGIAIGATLMVIGVDMLFF